MLNSGSLDSQEARNRVSKVGLFSMASRMISAPPFLRVTLEGGGDRGQSANGRVE
jgi:hypothetical protein